MQDILAFLALLLPLTLSPGPASIILTGIVINKGVSKAIPFCIGLIISAYVLVIASGFGLNEILLANKTVYAISTMQGLLIYFIWLGNFSNPHLQSLKNLLGITT